MSTHNIGFYEDLTKIIFELSSNIIKYAPYLFCCYLISTFNIFVCVKCSHRFMYEVCLLGQHCNRCKTRSEFHSLPLPLHGKGTSKIEKPFKSYILC